MGAAVKTESDEFSELVRQAIAQDPSIIRRLDRREGPIIKKEPSMIEGGPRVITDTALSLPTPPKYRKLKPGEEFKDLEAREREETMATALEQPHRQGGGGDRRTTAFGRFCEDYKPVRLGDHCYFAGERYCEVVREEKNARGLLVMGGAPRDPGYQIFEACPQLPCKFTCDAGRCQIRLKARLDLAIGRLKEDNEVLIAIMPRLPRALERLVYDQLEPSVYDFGILRDGLVLLAKKYGLRAKRYGEAD